MYSVIFSGQELELPNYNFGVVEKLEKADKVNNSQQTFKEKCKALYDLEKFLLGEDKLVEVVGTFNECDPNDVQLLYMGIVECYNQPIIEKQREQLEKTLDGYDFSKITRITEAMGKIKR